MDQWGAYPDSASGRRYNGNPPPAQPPVSRDYHGSTQGHAPAGFTFDQYQGAASAHPQSQAQSMAASPTAATQLRDGNGDVAMQDAGDPYSGMKYPMRPHHQQPLSGSRGGPHHSPQEPSAAAQRYSPMEALSPASPYGPPPTGQSQYGSQAASQRQSPTKSANYTSPTSYYTSRQQNQPQLPPITPYSSLGNESYPHSATAQLNAVFGKESKSPGRQGSQVPQGGLPGRGPVPQFTKVRSMADLKPKVNAQPAFRRANPEGGFISVRTTRREAKHVTDCYI
jgi:dual specificity protein kinase YAK1